MPSRWKQSISLETKCRIVFAAAILLIVAATLFFPWYRMEQLVQEQNQRSAWKLADAYLREIHPQQGQPRLTQKQIAQRWALFRGPDRTKYPPPVLINLMGKEKQPLPGSDPFIVGSIQKFADNPDRSQRFQVERTEEGNRFHYIQALRAGPKCITCHTGPGAVGKAEASAKRRFEPNELIGVLNVLMPTGPTDTQLVLNRVFLVLGALLAGVLAIIVFHLILHYLILHPVRDLRDVAEKVGSGDLDTRAEIATGDEFEELASAFNHMLTRLAESHQKLEQINKSLDAKLGELAQANLALDEANQLKSEFLANVSHELRTPLNSIIGFAEVLGQVGPPAADDPEQTKKRERVKKYSENIMSSGRMLLDLINDLLDLAKIESGKMEVRTEKVSLSDMCEALINLNRHAADQKRITLRDAVANNVPIIETDPGKLRQILFNFLSNGIKFTPPGGRVEMKAELAGPGQVAVTVTDTGPGIPKSAQKAIFEKFRQLDPTLTREQRGTGLGLPIAAELAKLLGGKITITSQPGQGAAFTLQLPFKREPEARGQSGKETK